MLWSPAVFRRSDGPLPYDRREKAGGSVEFKNFFKNIEKSLHVTRCVTLTGYTEPVKEKKEPLRRKEETNLLNKKTSPVRKDKNKTGEITY